MKCLSKYLSWCLTALAGFTINSYATNNSDNNPCANKNPYTQQTCEQLKISSDITQKSQAKDYQNQVSKNEEAARQHIKDQNNATRITAESAAQTAPAPPDWQKVLGGQDKIQNSTQTPPVADNNSDNNPPSVTPLPPPEQAQFSTPKSLTLPGGTNVIPSKPQNNGGSGNGRIKYY